MHQEQENIASIQNTPKLKTKNSTIAAPVKYLFIIILGK
jgi:hypothetical protein